MIYTFLTDYRFGLHRIDWICLGTILAITLTMNLYAEWKK